VLINGAAVRSCVMPIAHLSPNEITTLEGLGTLDKLHPLQKAFIDEQAAQCGYWCQLGVAHRVLDVPMTEVCLQRASVVASIGQGVAAGVA
jgi:aerobic-type carbon monoxide dehydrogenase small subunit (CoxS/CutS family)